MDLMEAHLQKIKLLLALAQSPEPNEAATANAMAQKLIEKFSVSEDQLKEIENCDKPVYTEENLLFETEVLADWKNILALAVANKYDCYIIQEENIISTGGRIFKYFVYGAQEDILICQQLYKFIYDKINHYIDVYCKDQDDLYVSSFGEGAAQGVKINIECEDFEISGVVKVQEKEEIKKDTIATVEKEKIKAPPIEKKTKVSGKEKDLDIVAYFAGENKGRSIHLGKIKAGKELPPNVVDYSLLANLLKT